MRRFRREHITRQPPLILIFDIRSITPLVHSNEERICTITVDYARYVELCGVSAALRIAHESAI